MKLTYWVANCLNDSHVYSIRKRTKREVVQALHLTNDLSGYSAPVKVTVEYDSAFHLLTQALSEGGIDEHRYDEGAIPYPERYK